MRALWQMKNGGPEVLTVRETPDPTPGPGEVRIRVRACGLNFAEVMARQGLYPDAPKPPCVLGYEAAGEVDALGPGVDGLALGTPVVALTRFGGHADVVCVPQAQVLPMPDGMDFETAAAIPVTYLTAYHMLFRVANLQPGARVLIHMAAGGVGIAALQLCATVEGVTTFGTASASKHEVLRAEGCDHPIDYRNTDYAARVRELTDGAGVDVVLDPLGGKDWATGLRLLRPVGHLVAFGFANMAGGERRSLLRMVSQGSADPPLHGAGPDGRQPLSQWGEHRTHVGRGGAAADRAVGRPGAVAGRQGTAADRLGASVHRRRRGPRAHHGASQHRQGDPGPVTTA